MCRRARDRAAHRRAGSSAFAPAPESPEARGARHPGHCLRQRRRRGRRHPPGRLRLLLQAVRRRPDQAGRQPRPAAEAPGRGEPDAAARGAREVSAREHRRPQRGHAPGLQDRRPRRGQRRDGAHPGRERVGQGARGPGHSPSLAARHRPLRHRRLRRALRGRARERAVRTRQGSLHRRAGGAARALRGGQRWHPLPRRDRQRLAQAPGPTAARAAGRREPPRRRQRRRGRQRSNRRRH